MNHAGIVQVYYPFNQHGIERGQPLLSLADEIDIEGPGIYCLVYDGAHEAYSSINGTELPIYGGKAVPPGSRMGGDEDISARVLRQRIREHRRSIEQATNLDVADFRYRALPIVPIWITLAERFLITHYKPVWNTCIDGFGDHDPGSGRYNGERSWWDTLHPGRTWAGKLQSIKTEGVALAKVLAFFDPDHDAPSDQAPEHMELMNPGESR